MTISVLARFSTSVTSAAVAEFIIHRPEAAGGLAVQHQCRNTIENGAGGHHDPIVRYCLLEPLSVVRRGENGFGDRQADLSSIDIERRDDFDVAGNVSSQVRTQHANRVFAMLAAIVNPLNQGTGAVSEADDGEPDHVISGMC